MTEYQASYRRCRGSGRRLRQKLERHDEVTIIAEETGGWFIEATQEAVLQLSTQTDLVFKEVN
jgi:hypothetical protein